MAQGGRAVLTLQRAQRIVNPVSSNTKGGMKQLKVKSIKPHSLLRRQDVANLHILKDVSLDEVWELMTEAPNRLLKKGDVLIEKGQTNTTFFLIARGRLSVILDSPKGRPVAFVESGQTVGELSVIDQHPTSAYVVAARPTLAVAVNQEIFWRLVAVSQQFAKNVFLLLAKRLRASNFTIAENMRLRKLLERDAAIDGLTGLRNRRWLNENLGRILARHQRSSSPLSLIMFDIDHFKRFNDTYGHGAGDRVLTTAGRAIETCLRPTDFGVRYGGEEFTVILPNTELSEGVIAAERLRLRIASMPIQTFEGIDLPPVTVSLGVAQLNGKDDPARLLKRVDEALYRAKARGRNRTEPA